MLAELMLPDQAHARKEDWTIFFLHKDTSEEESAADGEDAEQKVITEKEGHDSQDGARGVDGEASERGTDSGDTQGDIEGGEGPPLIYVLNLVNTKHDPSAKRYVHSDHQSGSCPNPEGFKRCRGQSNGDLHQTLLSSYL